MGTKELFARYVRPLPNIVFHEDRIKYFKHARFGSFRFGWVWGMFSMHGQGTTYLM